MARPSGGKREIDSPLCVFEITPAFAEYSPTIPVNCELGQSLNATLSRLFKQVPVTVLVQGTCTGYITINGFTGLTLKGLPGAALKQPTTNPGNGVPVYVLLIEASQSITIDGLAIHSRPFALGGVAVGRNSIDVELRNLTVDGGRGRSKGRGSRGDPREARLLISTRRDHYKLHHESLGFIARSSPKRETRQSS
jgi:hypothetical protein